MWEQFSLCRNFIAATEAKGELCAVINEEKYILLNIQISITIQPSCTAILQTQSQCCGAAF
jgi:hypothetical protein